MIYLISPYKSNNKTVMEARFLSACQACAMLARVGEIVYSPIVHWHPVAETFDLPKGHEFWEFHDHHMIELAERIGLLKLSGWRESKGFAKDFVVAISLRKPIHTLDISHGEVKWTD